MDPLALNDVLFQKRGRLGVITLNRPGVINAVNQAMVSAIHRTLADWAVDDAVRAVLLTGNGDRGLCVGGDIAAIFRDATGGSDGSLTFWRDEYLLDAAIARYPKPVVTLMDGIVLGGGIGLAAHASHRVGRRQGRARGLLAVHVHLGLGCRSAARGVGVAVC